MKQPASILLAIVISAGTAAAQDPLSAAKDLYASAAYEDALAALSRVQEGSPELAQQVDQYRAFSLFALGRTAEAESVVEAVIRRDPMMKPDSRDASPRITALFVQVRKRLLPELIRDGYREARAMMDKGDLAGAVPRLEQVRSMLAEAKTLGLSNESLADMGVLVDGFLDLAKNVNARPPAEAPAAAKAETPAAPAAAAAEPANAETIVARAEMVFSATDLEVTAPVAIRQQMPTIPYNLARSMANSKGAGVLEVTINERGRVDSATMREPVNPFFDSVVIAAARSWQYRPAMKSGEPVKYMKRIGVSVASLVK